jgi:ADP-heptose:LPS heptosyltransferase
MSERAEPYRSILIIDLLGGLGDLVMALPVVHALARRHPGAALQVLTYPPGDTLLYSDPAVTGVSRAAKGRELASVVAEIERHQPDLVVSTTRYGGIAKEIESRGMRSVTNLWRKPPPDQPVSRRYLRILAAEGLIDDGYLAPKIHLTDRELAAGARVLNGCAPTGAPVVLVPSAGMTVKVWPHWAALAKALMQRGAPTLVVAEHMPAEEWVGTLAQPVPPTDLRGLASFFAAVAHRGGVVVGPDTGPVRVAGAVGARTVGLFGPTAAVRYGLDAPAVNLQGLPACTYRRPTSITEQVCWWDADCPLSKHGPACMADISAATVLAAI